MKFVYVQYICEECHVENVILTRLISDNNIHLRVVNDWNATRVAQMLRTTINLLPMGVALDYDCHSSYEIIEEVFVF